MSTDTAKLFSIILLAGIALVLIEARHNDGIIYVWKVSKLMGVCALIYTYSQFTKAFPPANEKKLSFIELLGGLLQLIVLCVLLGALCYPQQWEIPTEWGQ